MHNLTDLLGLILFKLCGETSRGVSLTQVLHYNFLFFHLVQNLLGLTGDVKLFQI